jgi:hypothetical protein
MNPRSIILVLGLSMFSAAYADDYESPGERAPYSGNQSH